MDIRAVPFPPNKSRFVWNRLPVILEYCKGKTVLDVGCVDHDALQETHGAWMHKAIRDVASDLVGVDMEAEEVEKLRQKGYSIITGDVEKITLGRTFDVCVAGELIEHLSNPGRFLENMYIHLASGGTLILTTPNAFAIRYHIAHLLHGRGSINPQHTFYYDYYTLLELCQRHGFRLRESYYFLDDKPSLLKRLFIRLVLFIRKSYAPRMLFVLDKIS